ncbi:MAG: phosphate ABC transporter substrate-binding protein PstS [Phycisphaerales bacterium]
MTLTTLFHNGLAAAAIAMATTGAIAADVKLTGAGATFPQPLYERWTVEYQKANPDVKITYEGGGSGAGIKRITDKTCAFGASDAPLSEKEIEALGGTSAVIQFPTVAGGVVPAYNIPDVKSELKFTGEVISDIYLGKISKWNDKAITDLNPGVKLPDLAITPAWRSDGSGTTYVFTSYLATQSKDFKTAVGAGKQVKWPVGTGGKGNPGVAAVITQTPGAFGYIEQNYAVANKIAYGSVKNAAGEFVKATIPSMTAAGEGAVDKLKGTVLKADIWNQPGKNAYPITAFTYIIVNNDLRSVKTMDEAVALKKFLAWALSDAGQKIAGDMDYAPLSKGVQKASQTALETVTFEGKPVNAK